MAGLSRRVPAAMARRFVLLLWAVASPVPGAGMEHDIDSMLRDVQETLHDTRAYTGKEHFDPRVLEAMRRVPRHEFVPPAWRASAYLDQALPIGNGQTISQPYIVALMTDLAGLSGTDRVLEVGTGSGYQAAVLAEIVHQVFTVEIDAGLGLRAARTLARLGYSNITTRIGDGYHGWPEEAPFDAIIVTAAPDTVPEPLLQQLKPGGRLVIPVGRKSGPQSLQLITVDEHGKRHIRDVLPVGFVPLTGEH